MQTDSAVATLESRLAPGALPEASCGDWYVLHVKSRQEKALDQDLAAMKISHYLPLIKQVRFYGGREALVMQPLFPGYMFLRGSLEMAYRADRTKRLARVIPVGDQHHIQWELSNLHLALSHEMPLELYSYLRKGVRVEVRSGPLRGLQLFVQVLGATFGRCPQETIDALEVTLDALVAGDALDGIDGSGVTLIDELRGLGRVDPFDGGESGIDHAAKVSRGPAAFATGDETIFQHQHFSAFFEQQVGGGESGNAATDDADIGLHVTGECLGQGSVHAHPRGLCAAVIGIHEDS